MLCSRPISAWPQRAGVIVSSFCTRSPGADRCEGAEAQWEGGYISYQCFQTSWVEGASLSNVRVLICTLVPLLAATLPQS